MRSSTGISRRAAIAALGAAASTPFARGFEGAADYGVAALVDYYAGLAADQLHRDGASRGPIDYYLDPTKQRDGRGAGAVARSAWLATYSPSSWPPCSSLATPATADAWVAVSNPSRLGPMTPPSRRPRAFRCCGR